MGEKRDAYDAFAEGLSRSLKWDYWAIDWPALSRFIIAFTIIYSVMRFVIWIME